MTQPTDYWRRHSYHGDTTDLSVIRDQANRRAKRELEATVIHLHAYEQGKWPECKDIFDHEYVLAGS